MLWYWKVCECACARERETVAAAVLTRTASSLHSSPSEGGGGERGRKRSVCGSRRWVSRGGAAAAADVAPGLSPALSDGDAAWIGVCLSAGGREGGRGRGRGERRRGKCGTGSGVSGKKPQGNWSDKLHFAAREFFWIEASSCSVWIMTPTPAPAMLVTEYLWIGATWDTSRQQQ